MKEKLNEFLKYYEVFKAFNNYCYREYDGNVIEFDDFIKSIIENNGVLHIAYTTDDYANELQSAYDLKNNDYLAMVNGEVMQRDKVTLGLLIDDLNNASFDDFIRDCWQYAEEYELVHVVETGYYLDIEKYEGRIVTHTEYFTLGCDANKKYKEIKNELQLGDFVSTRLETIKKDEIESIIELEEFIKE